jgi:hypothetical protein
MGIVIEGYEKSINKKHNKMFIIDIVFICEYKIIIK